MFEISPNINFCLKFSLTNRVVVVKGQAPWSSYDLELAEGKVRS